MKITREHAELFFQSAGEGPAILFAHGAGGNAASWYQQVPFFRSCGFRTIIFDHRGFARSRCAVEHFHPKYFAEDALAILDALNIERAAVVCQSMGGWTGSRLAALYPDRVSHLVLGNTPGAIMSDALLAQARSIPVPQPGGTHPAISAAFAQRNPAGATLYAALADFSTVPMPINTLFARESFLDDSQIERLRAQQVLVIASEWDQLFPVHLLCDTAARIGAQFAEVAGAGHSTYFERPDEFNRIVSDFLGIAR